MNSEKFAFHFYVQDNEYLLPFGDPTPTTHYTDVHVTSQTLSVSIWDSFISHFC